MTQIELITFHYRRKMQYICKIKLSIGKYKKNKNIQIEIKKNIRRRKKYEQATHLMF